MPKVYTEEEKAQQLVKMFNLGLQLIMEKGYKNVKVEDLVNLIGVSKGYFYLIFSSKEGFILDAIAWQMEKVFSIMEDAKANGLCAEKTGFLYHDIFKQLHLTNYEDFLYIKRKAGKDTWEKFKKFEESYFTKILKLLDKEDSGCDPKVISNLSSIIYLSYNMKKEGSYLFPEKGDEVTELLLDTLHRYVHEKK